MIRWFLIHQLAAGLVGIFMMSIQLSRLLGWSGTLDNPKEFSKGDPVPWWVGVILQCGPGSVTSTFGNDSIVAFDPRDLWLHVWPADRNHSGTSFILSCMPNPSGLGQIDAVFIGAPTVWHGSGGPRKRRRVFKLVPKYA